MKDIVKIGGNVHLVLTDENGKVKIDRVEKNMIVYTGTTHIADQLCSAPSEGAMSHMAIGTDSTAAGSAQAGLLAEAARVALTGRTHTNNVVTYTCTFSAGAGTGVLREAAIFNNAVGGIMLARLVYGIITKAAGDSFAVSWTLTINDDGV